MQTLTAPEAFDTEVQKRARQGVAAPCMQSHCSLHLALTVLRSLGYFVRPAAALISLNARQVKIMISKYFRREPTVLKSPSRRLPDGMTLWAIGDVHGCLDLLHALATCVVEDAEARTDSKNIAVFLGDYVDRGPDSKGVLRYLCDLANTGNVEWRFLKGNHEETMARFLSDPTVGQKWCDYGGDATLASYGLARPQMRHRIEAWASLSKDLDHCLTKSERNFIDTLEISFSVGNYFLSHAGAKPGVPLHKQSSKDLMWIRESFLNSRVQFERIVIHGHTPASVVYADDRRIGVDTKAYATGRLSAVRITNETCEVVQAVRELKNGAPALMQSDASRVSIHRTPLQQVLV